MSKQITSKPAAALRKAASFLTLLLCGLYPAAVTGVNAQTMEQEAATAKSGGPKEGIKVHGHWTIEVRNPDGKLVTRREFENALVPGPTLASILGRTSTTGTWSIVLLGSPVAPCTVAGEAIGCTLVESNFPGQDFNRWNTLKVSAPASGANTNALVLSGSFTAGKDTNIKTVSTYLTVCGPDVTPNSCALQPGGPQPITATTLPDAVNGSCAPNTSCAVHVVPGQIVQVTVAISFS